MSSHLVKPVATLEQMETIVRDGGKKIFRLEVEVGIVDAILSWCSRRTSTNPLYVNLCTGKVGSEQWLYLLVRSLLPAHKVIRRASELDQTVDVDILYMDDWTLSGSQAVGTAEQVLYPKINALKNVHYYIITYVATVDSQELIKMTNEMYPGVTFHQTFGVQAYRLSQAVTYYQQFSTFSTPLLIDQDQMKTFIQMHNPESQVDGHLIYSDYKIPSDFSSYPSIYDNLITELDREFMQVVEEEYMALTN